MNRKAFLKISAFSLLLALLLSFCSLLFLNEFASRQGARFRDDFLSFFAGSLERRIQNLSLAEIQAQSRTLLRDDRHGPRPPGPPPPHAGLWPPPMMRPPPPGEPPDRRQGLSPRPPGPGGPNPPQIWLVDGKGRELARSQPGDEDVLAWDRLPRPQKSGVVLSKDDGFGFGASYSVIKLNAHENLFLVMRDPKKPFWGALLITQVVLTSGMIILALIGSLSILFFYLKRKSTEARSVLKRLESGDLKARFEIKRFDEFGELLLDFNRMADEIETLVRRIHTTEQKRKTLLQELGHDLRTPLTSLKTNFEILQNHDARLSAQDKHNLFGVLTGEIDYFKDLIEKLITIASLDEPHYKSSTEQVKLDNLIRQEIQLRQKSGENSLHWRVEITPGSRPILGDSHLILRLLRNALDNAARYAESQVLITLKQTDAQLKLGIQDDGPGLDEETQKTFGERHEFRGRRMTKGGHFSLGLGSVIMKTITELHHGQLRIGNKPEGGALLEITLPTI